MVRLLADGHGAEACAVPVLLLYAWAEMAFCSHCGKPGDGGRFCAACGAPIAPDAVAAMTAELDRHRQHLRLLVVALAVACVLTAGLIISWAVYAQRTVGRVLLGANTAVSVQQPLPDSGSGLPATSDGQQERPRATGAAPATGPDKNADGIDPQAVENALATLAPPGQQERRSSQQRSAPTAASPDSDRYPGAQPVEVKDANLPDIGVPVASQVYTTSDSLSTVVSYYKKRYPGAEVTDISGQQIIAVGGSKVIAIGTTGSETRIAIVQLAD